MASCHRRRKVLYIGGAKVKITGGQGGGSGKILDFLLAENPDTKKTMNWLFMCFKPGRVAQSVGHLTRKSGVLGSIPGLATYFRFSFRFFKKGSCQLLAKVCARSTG